MEAERLNAVSNKLADLEPASRRSSEVSLTSMRSVGRLDEVIKLGEDPALWQDNKRAQEIGKERKALEAVVGTVQRVSQGLAGQRVSCWSMVRDGRRRGWSGGGRARRGGAGEAGGGDGVPPACSPIPMDPNNCFLDIQAGQGGTEAQDWAADARAHVPRATASAQGFKVGSAGGVAGRSRGAQERIAQDHGRLCLRHTCAPRTGIHRLVRKSPFDSNARRHTSFAQRIRLPGGRRHHRDRDQSGGPAHRHLSAPAARAASTSTRPTRRCASRTCRPASWCSARTIARSTATAPRRWRC